ncbi:MAG: hypothetical protein WDW36_004872 [Sanguina aurantia]
MQAPQKRTKCSDVAAANGGASTLVGVTPAEGRQQGLALLDYINNSWTPYHAVDQTSKRLLAAGFQQISERDQWKIKAGGRYFFTRSLTTIVAFAVGAKFAPGNGFFMVGAHTDSPCLKLKPVSKSTRSGCLMVNVETYGGGLWTTWFDRDLGLAGRVLVRGPGGALQPRLVQISRPILRIPMLAIHLQRDIAKGFAPNPQTNLAPLLATAVKAQLSYPSAAAATASPSADSAASDSAQPTEPTSAPPADPSTSDPSSSSSPAAAAADSGRHHPALVSLLAAELGVEAADIVDFELHVCDVQPGVLGGLAEEFVFAGRLDNLAMSYCCLQALLDTCPDEASLAEETGVRSIALFDHEEVGSSSAQGAGGPVMRDAITRVASSLSEGQEGAVERSLRNSFLVSADMAHALHPNYSDKHDPDHQPKFHGGLVLKHNGNQRYATNATSATLFREIGRIAGVPCQEFSVRNDSPCGSTIGPILASALGCRTVDVGIPQLSMHSIREMCGVDDVSLALRHFSAFFREFSALDATVDLDTLAPAPKLYRIDEAPCNHMH